MSTGLKDPKEARRQYGTEKPSEALSEPRDPTQDHHTAITVLALYGGRIAPTERYLKRHGIEGYRDLAQLADTEEFQAATQRTRELLAEEQEAAAYRFIQLEHELMDRLQANLHDIPTRELAQNIKHIAAARHIALTHRHHLRGEPSAIVEHRSSPAELLKRLKTLLDPHIDSEAIEDAETVENGDRAPIRAEVERDAEASASSAFKRSVKARA